MRAQSSMAVLATLVLALLAAGCRSPGGVRLTFIPQDQTLEEKTVIREAGWFPAKIAVVDVSGILLDQEVPSLLAEGENPVSFVKEQLERAGEDPAVEAVILRVNSPGGTVTASQILYEEINRYKARTGKPVVAVFMDVAASGGYYASCAADRIVAYPTTITGSIGVIMQLFSLQGTLSAIHMKTYAIKSGPFKDAGSPLRDLEPAERQIFDSIVQQFYSQFVTVVDNGRPGLSREQVQALADGRIYTAEQAHAAGLVDEIGSLYTAIRWIKDRTGHQKMNVVVYHRPQDWRGSIYATAPSHTAPHSQAGPLNIDPRTLDDMLRPKFLYLWAPGLTPSGR